jgi:hypothetical protein
VKWSTAVIAGGGIAGLTQGVTTLLRAKSTVSLLALAAPLLALALVVVLLWFAIRLLRRITRGQPAKPT